MANVRVVAAEAIGQVLRGRSLSAVLPKYSQKVADNDQALFKELCFGTLRWYPQLQAIVNHLMSKPIKDKEREIQALLACGIYQLMHMRVADHAAINETVAATVKLKRLWAKGLVNAVLRNFQRQQEQIVDKLSKNSDYATAHPQWIVDRLHKAWPEQAQEILAANNLQAPMCLRVNASRCSRDDYLTMLTDANINAEPTQYSECGILLDKPQEVTELPGFADGLASVQDESAQLAASLLDVQPGHVVLDACCAPGGKTCHILESEPKLALLTAIDLEQTRLERCKDNLQRLDLQANLIAADVGAIEMWWDNKPFDRILLDAPCSASGVIRRHPDIKLLRKNTDIDNLSKIQTELLEKVWKTLRKGGILVYATCSVLPQENDSVVAQFLAANDDASLIKIEADWGRATDFGRQIFPSAKGGDGFYYSRLKKIADNG
ncbi:MAG: 16S rRNA (cytosine(967)-C(5))-methyltransferase RsmB [Porticoccaceae bacterium]|nr:16S rRNA (cytosine(967)-C(5))-methyltransferase RsmB [Porticoccaceae bacterium]